MKLVKPTKIASRTSDQPGFHHFLFPQAEPQMRAAQAAILGKADAASGWELGGFDLPDGIRDHRTEAVTLPHHGVQAGSEITSVACRPTGLYSFIMLTAEFYALARHSAR